MVLWSDKTLTCSIAVSRAAAAIVPLIWSQSKNQRMLVYCVQISVWTEPQQFTKKFFIQYLTYMALCHSDWGDMRRTNWDCATNLHIWPHTCASKVTVIRALTLFMVYAYFVYFSCCHDDARGDQLCLVRAEHKGLLLKRSVILYLKVFFKI